MLSGRLRERIELFSRSVSIDAYGQEQITWVSDGAIWAEPVYSTLKGDSGEMFNAGQMQDQTTIRFRIRYKPEVSQTWRLEYRSSGYDIQGVTHETHKYTIIRAIEGQKDGR